VTSNRNRSAPAFSGLPPGFNRGAQPSHQLSQRAHIRRAGCYPGDSEKHPSGSPYAEVARNLLRASGGRPAQGSPKGRAPPVSLDTDNYFTALTPRAQFRAPFLYVSEGFFLPRVHSHAPPAYGHCPSIFGVRNLKDGFGFTFIHTQP
jgi:hypothetical protein